MAYLRNAWYVGTLSRELQSKPLGRTLLDEPVVFYRDDDGATHALADRCPHRFVPLSMGRVCGSELECGYHGLRFAPDGTCARNPHGKKIVPERARVRAYPTIERYGFVWYWPGDAERASSQLLPDLPYLEDPRFVANTEVVHCEANYQLVIDNLLDLSHVEFLHPTVLGQAEGLAVHVAECFQEGDVVVSNRWKPNSLVHGFVKKYFWTSPSERVDARSNMRWSAPARLDFDLGSTEVGGKPEDGVCLPAVHLMTPQTRFFTYYFFATARNRRLDDTELGETWCKSIVRLFNEEDGPMIAAQQRAIGQTDSLVEGRPVMLEPDEPSIRARRILARLIREEASGISQPAVAAR